MQTEIRRSERAIIRSELSMDALVSAPHRWLFFYCVMAALGAALTTLDGNFWAAWGVGLYISSGVTILSKMYAMSKFDLYYEVTERETIPQPNYTRKQPYNPIRPATKKNKSTQLARFTIEAAKLAEWGRAIANNRYKVTQKTALASRAFESVTQNYGAILSDLKRLGHVGNDGYLTERGKDFFYLTSPTPAMMPLN